MTEEQQAFLMELKKIAGAYENLRNNPSFGIIVDHFMDNYVYRNNTELERVLVEQYPDASHRALLKEGQAQIAMSIKRGLELSTEDINNLNEALENV